MGRGLFPPHILKASAAAAADGVCRAAARAGAGGRGGHPRS